MSFNSLHAVLCADSRSFDSDGGRNCESRQRESSDDVGRDVNQRSELL
uniref:Uncharacterized protein n=1 Tax=Arundo donax TaxID=35708 RepID=A0A0A9C6T8_ARUDO